ncbi:hypothetical protein [Frankia sp. QA3]|uniref:hypothetical protein n=1 Tax=Frankia sp. QA3 TaxID=710111 RepID=UPI000269BE8C|nr:hypothetical protein [Frankia sp. QA3]EIV93080.1 hypothetical protein FraQA3DRAFT_2756 [Frankia sp. QA3]
MRHARWGKLLGVAGLVGVAATGVLVARDHRQRGSYSPDEIRARLQARAATDGGSPPTTPAGSSDPGTTTPPGSSDPGTTATPREPGLVGEPTGTRRARLLGWLPHRFTRRRPGAIR